MFRGDSGKWSRWGLGFLWGWRRRAAAGGCVGHALEPHLAPVGAGTCARVCLGHGSWGREQARSDGSGYFLGTVC